MILITVLLFLILFINFLCIAEVSLNRDIIIGQWVDEYPVPDLVYGYIFFEDGTYVYYDERPYNLKYKYDGSMGEWKLEGNKIMIYPEKELYWKNDWVEDKALGYLVSGEFNSLYAIKGSQTWQIIGDIRLYTEAKAYQKEDKHDDDYSKPANLMLYFIMIGQIVKRPRPYWQTVINPSDDEECKRILAERKNPSKVLLPEKPKDPLTMDYAKYYHQFPGGQELSPKEQQEQIVIANTLSDEGLSYYKAKKDDLAIVKYEEALQHYASAEIYYRYGNSLSNTIRLKDAVKAYINAGALNYDKQYLVDYNIACALSKLHDKGALVFLEVAIDDDGYKNFDHIEKDEDLAWLRSIPEWKDWWAKYQKP